MGGVNARFLRTEGATPPLYVGFRLGFADRPGFGLLNQQANTSGSTPAKKAASFEVAYFLM